MTKKKQLKELKKLRDRYIDLLTETQKLIFDLKGKMDRR